MAIEDDMLSILRTAGLIDGDTGWTGRAEWMPPTGDKIVLVSGYGGSMPSASTGPGRVGWDEPSVQIRVRGPVNDLAAAKDKLAAIDAALRPTSDAAFPQTVGDVTYLWVKARQSEPLFLGKDGNDRPEYTRNYDVGRSR